MMSITQNYLVFILMNLSILACKAPSNLQMRDVEVYSLQATPSITNGEIVELMMYPSAMIVLGEGEDLKLEMPAKMESNLPNIIFDHGFNSESLDDMDDATSTQYYEKYVYHKPLSQASQKDGEFHYSINKETLKQFININPQTYHLTELSIAGLGKQFVYFIDKSQLGDFFKTLETSSNDFQFMVISKKNYDQFIKGKSWTSDTQGVDLQHITSTYKLFEDVKSTLSSNHFEAVKIINAPYFLIQQTLEKTNNQQWKVKKANDTYKRFARDMQEGYLKLEEDLMTSKNMSFYTIEESQFLLYNINFQTNNKPDQIERYLSDTSDPNHDLMQFENIKSFDFTFNENGISIPQKKSQNDLVILSMSKSSSQNNLYDLQTSQNNQTIEFLAESLSMSHDEVKSTKTLSTEKAKLLHNQIMEAIEIMRVKFDQDFEFIEGSIPNVSFKKNPLAS